VDHAGIASPDGGAERFPGDAFGQDQEGISITRPQAHGGQQAGVRRVGATATGEQGCRRLGGRVDDQRLDRPAFRREISLQVALVRRSPFDADACAIEVDEGRDPGRDQKTLAVVEEDPRKLDP
jgi:hypothetical protein